MKRVAVIILIVLLATAARSDGIYNPGGRGIPLSEGPFNSGAAGVVAGCASPTAPNGILDLSQCSNAFYAAVTF